MAKLRQLPTGVNTSSRTVVREATGVVYQHPPTNSLEEADNHPLHPISPQKHKFSTKKNTKFSTKKSKK
ncbi:MAG: hypothetical protein KIG52_02045 [Muribaculaceae bacterium]|nr:hypothetical protein [Muribaculaceae bacterium]